jgi:predicted DNA-binding transcriptional regulator AlpA/predicted nucleotidyltransferase
MGYMAKNGSSPEVEFLGRLVRVAGRDHLVLAPSEVARLLGVSRQRVYELIRTHQDFPSPLVTKNGVGLWSRAEIERWASRWARKPGRPSRGASPPAPPRTRGIGDPTLDLIVSRLVDIYTPERIYLFGSRARGEAGSTGDYDLLVVVPDGAPPERQRAVAAYEALWGTAVAADVLVQTRAYFEARQHVEASLPATVGREGLLLYDTRSDQGRGDEGLAAAGG